MKKLFNKIKPLISVVLPIIIALCAAWVFVTFFFQIVYVVGDSMLPSFESGQTLVISKHLTMGELERYDVVVVNSPAWSRVLIKRVIGLPGETIQIIDGKVYIDGKELEDDTYCSELIEDAGIAAEPVTLGEGEYFVMGDNRNVSADSRIIGVVTRKEIVGRVQVRISPWTVY